MDGRDRYYALREAWTFPDIPAFDLPGTLPGLDLLPPTTQRSRLCLRTDFVCVFLGGLRVETDKIQKCPDVLDDRQDLDRTSDPGAPHDHFPDAEQLS